MNLGKLGIWAIMDTLTAEAAAAFAKRVEGWGYNALWVPESASSRNIAVISSWLLANTSKLTVASGIASIYARDAVASLAAQNALCEQSGGRFLLGLGVSHARTVEGFRHHEYKKPIPAMRDYLEAMSQAKYGAPKPAEKPSTVIAALGPKMLEVASLHADGAHPYNVTPEHTAQARAILGPGKMLCPEQMVVLEKDAATARAIGRRVLGVYLALPNYANNLKRLGFTDADFHNGGSDRLIDGLVAWGNEDAIRARIKAHWDAGADHVCIQSLPHEKGGLTPSDEKIFELLAQG